LNKDKNPNAMHKWLEIAYQEVLKEEGFIWMIQLKIYMNT
jgi:hypothetical protein